MNRLFSRVKYVLRNEGFIPLIRRVPKFLYSASFEYQRFYLYELHIGEKRNQADYMPKIENFTFKIIETTQQLDELNNGDFNLSLMDIVEARWRLIKGAVTLLIFVDNELAYRGWIGMTENAKSVFNHYPYRVNFSKGEICGGDIWTNPKYRRQGLSTYVDYERENFLRERGVKNMRWIIKIVNTPSQGASAKYGGEIYAKAWYLRIFGLKFWKETPVT